MIASSPYMHRSSSSSSPHARRRTKLGPSLFVTTEDDVFEGENDGNSQSFVLSASAMRSEGLTIGCDYVRMQGVTMMRGHVFSNTITVHEVIGRGAFSTVRRGLWTRQSSSISTTPPCSPVPKEATLENKENSGISAAKPATTVAEDTITVAVKEWFIDDSDTSIHARRHRHALLQELRALCTLSAISPALVQLHGAFLNPVASTNPSLPSVTVVLEFMDRGSLQDYLEQQQSGRQQQCGLGEPLIAAILYQILMGLSALHAPERRLLHRDLKPANVLLHSNGAVKLCDFGLATTQDASQLKQDNGSSGGGGRDTVMHRTVIGTAQYMAPERLRARPYGRSSDVWSLGLIVWQCVTGQTQPFLNENYHNDNNDDNVPSSQERPRRLAATFSMVDLLVTIEEMTVEDLVRSLEQTRTKSNGERPSSPLAVSAGLQEILSGCLQVDPAKRMPASLLMQSPWFGHQNIQSLKDALEQVQASLRRSVAYPNNTTSMTTTTLEHQREYTK